eukprot:5052975-Alexandrium_andersonii.AAC.1
MPGSRTDLGAPRRVVQARQYVADDQTEPRMPGSSPSIEAGNERAVAATLMRRAEDKASD